MCGRVEDCALSECRYDANGDGDVDREEPRGYASDRLSGELLTQFNSEFCFSHWTSGRLWLLMQPDASGCAGLLFPGYWVATS